MPNVIGKGTWCALLGAILFGLATASAAATVQINSGGGAASPFVADMDFVGGTAATNWTGAIDTSAAANPAPQAVYQAERYGASTYTIAGFVAGSTQTIRFHFCENFFTAIGKRSFNVAINGTTVLTNYDIFATTGAAHKANIQQFAVAANASGQYIVQFTNVTNNALINGIEIVGATATPSATATPAPTATTTTAPTATLTATATPTGTASSGIGINSGGSAASPFVADMDFVGGTAATNWTGAIDTSAASNPAPQAVYQAERYGASTYTIPGFAPGSSQTVRLHFCENFFTAAGSRVFNVSINGTAVLTRFDIFAATGATHKANVQQFMTAANGSGQVVIQLTNVTNNALINGIEIQPGGPTPSPTITATPGPTPTTGPTPTPGVGAISPLLVGNNVWNNPSSAVWNASAGARLRMIRIGGASYDHTMPSNATLTSWVNNIKALGAEPLIQVSQYAGATAAASVVRYFNVTTGNHVTYWNIGNEPWCQNGRPGDLNALAQSVAGYVKPIASAMKSVDPTIKIFAPDDCDYFDTEYNALFGGGGSADITGKDGNGHYYVDGMSWHRYVGGDLATAGANDIISREQKARARVDLSNQLRGRTGADALQWGIGEFNANGGGGVCSYANGQMFGQVYGGLMKYGGTYATTWSMLENGGSCTGTDFSFLNANLTPRASYYHMQMVSQNFSGTYADGHSNVSSIRSYGAVDTDKIAVMLINVGGAQTCSVRLNNDPISGSCTVNIDAGTPVTFTHGIGGTTSIVMVFNGQGQLTKLITYSSGSTPQTQVFTP